MDIPKSDVQFIKTVLLPWANLDTIYLQLSNSKKVWPDIWIKKSAIPIITVTREWRSHDKHLRRSQLVHEFLHLKGLEHNDSIGYSTYPEKDLFSKKVYRRLTQ